MNLIRILFFGVIFLILGSATLVLGVVLLPLLIAGITGVIIFFLLMVIFHKRPPE